jgi:hypothetical protein
MELNRSFMLRTAPEPAIPAPLIPAMPASCPAARANPVLRHSANAVVLMVRNVRDLQSFVCNIFYLFVLFSFPYLLFTCPLALMSGNGH